MNETELTRIYLDETPIQMAAKIYKDFIVGQSCTIVGWEEPGITKGRKVLEALERMYNSEHVKFNAGGKRQRKNIEMKNSIGGYVAHKIWRFDKNMLDIPKYTIWRAQ